MRRRIMIEAGGLMHAHHVLTATQPTRARQLCAVGSYNLSQSGVKLWNDAGPTQAQIMQLRKEAVNSSLRPAERNLRVAGRTWAAA